MKKKAFVISTAVIMLIASRFAVRIIDTTVQIDDDIIILIAFLLIMNLIIGFVSYKIYKMTINK